MATESVLVNYVYAHNVGHAVEALHFCHGYHLADPGRRIGVVLNKRTATELGRLCPCVDVVYEVDLDLFDAQADVTAALAGIPREWDWVVADLRSLQDFQRSFFPGLAAYYDAAKEYFQPAKGFGFAGFTKKGPSYTPHQQLRLDLPEDDLAWGKALLGTEAPTRIAVLPGGSSPREYYPSVESWELVLGGLAEQFPGVRFCFTGKLGEDGRTSTSFGRTELDRLLAAFPGSVAAVDVPLTRQLGALHACDLLLSPHSGFSMAALATGTPWLALSGNRWFEYYFTGTPFYSVLPDRERFPCYTLFAEDPALVEEPGGPRTPSMTRARFEADLPEIRTGAELLVSGWPYVDALSDHFRRLNTRFPDWTTWFFSIDDVHSAFLS